MCTCAGGIGEVCYDIGYGGAFYALVDVNQLNMTLDATPLHKLEQTATAISKAVRYMHVHVQYMHVTVRTTALCIGQRSS